MRGAYLGEEQVNDPTHESGLLPDRIRHVRISITGHVRPPLVYKFNTFR
jgi:hypothetical protein